MVTHLHRAVFHHTLLLGFALFVAHLVLLRLVLFAGFAHRINRTKGLSAPSSWRIAYLPRP